MYFLIKRPFLALLLEKMHVLIHPHSKYPTYTLKVNTLHTPSKVNTSKYLTYTLKSKYPTYTLKVNTSKYPTYTLKSKYK